VLVVVISDTVGEHPGASLQALVVAVAVVEPLESTEYVKYVVQPDIVVVSQTSSSISAYVGT